MNFDENTEIRTSEKEKKKASVTSNRNKMCRKEKVIKATTQLNYE